jgi:hypothetical protein
MKNLILSITLILSMNVYAQNRLENTNIFLRVYNLESKKIYKGKILSVSETALHLSRNGESIEIPVSSIGSIKTKRSGGNNVLIGAASGATVMGILGAATAEPDAIIMAYSAGEGAAGGAIIGGIAGTLLGGFTVLFKNSKSYDINGDEAKWKTFTETILNN